MSEYIKGFIKLNKPQFSKYRKYTVTNDWSTKGIDENLGDSFFIDYLSDDSKKVKKAEIEKFLKEKIAAQKSSIKFKSDEFKLQNDLMSYILDRLKVFCKKAEGDHHKVEFKKFIKECLETINTHTDRVDIYVNSVDISQIENQEVRSEEMKFMKECFAGVTKIQDAITALNIKDDTADTSGIQFHENTKIAQLCMHDILYEQYPEIKRKIDSMGLDFTSPPNNEMHIHNENPPQWNSEKHYFDQEKETLQYYINEFKKLKYGITVDGLEMEPWLYFHINHFQTEIPITIIDKITGEKKTGKKVKVPELRDNEYYIIQDSYRTARKEEKMLFIAATRRLFKSTGLASHLYHIAITGGKELVVAGGSAKDLGQLEKNIKVCSLNINPAFAVNNISNDWTKKIPLGIRTKTNKIISQAIIHIINLDGGAVSNSEILAGFTPDAFAIDEIMKAPFIDQLNGAKPSFDTPEGKLCTAILSGTGGNEELSRDALTVLKDPDDYDILPMDWDKLERNIPKEHITWKRQNFGTFAPAQMSAKIGMVKIESNLEKYLQLENAPNLRKIKILVTDWKRCIQIIREDRKKKQKHKPTLVKEIVYYPISPEEIFLSGKTNPFPYEVATVHLERKRQSGDLGRKIDLVRNGVKIETPPSTKEIPNFPFEGGFFDSPVLIFGSIPEEKPPIGLYLLGGDDYKQEQSGTDSLGCFVVYKRQSGNDEWGDRIAAIYTSRPDPHRKFHMWGHMLCEMYNAQNSVLIENEDMEFKVYLDTIRETDKYLVPTFNVAADLNIKNNGRRQYGISPQGNKSAIINKVINYCNEIIVTHNEDGTTSQILGVERIDDEMLLEEIINYKEGENHDRITAFGIALIQAHKMDAEYIPIRLTEPKHEINKEVIVNRSPIRMGRGRTRL